MTLPGVQDVELRTFHLSFDEQGELKRAELRWRRLDAAGEVLVGFTAQEVLAGPELADRRYVAVARRVVQAAVQAARYYVERSEQHLWAGMGISRAAVREVLWQQYDGDDQGLWIRYERRDGQGQSLGLGELLIEEKGGKLSVNNWKRTWDAPEDVAQFRGHAQALMAAGRKLARLMDGMEEGT